MNKKTLILFIIIVVIIIIINFIAFFIFSQNEKMKISSIIFNANIQKCEDIHLLIDALILNIKKSPSETIIKLEVFRNNTPISYEGINVKTELINSGLIQKQGEIPMDE